MRNQGGVISFLLVLVFSIFLTLKLCGVIAWSWWWVTAPLWGGVAILACVVVFRIIIIGITLLIILLQTFLGKK